MIALVLVLMLQDPEPARTNQDCMKCHEDDSEDNVVKLWKGSVHAKEKVGCVECHGADDVGGEKPRKHQHRPTFRSGNLPRMIPDLCGACHAAERDEFLQSSHGSATQAGRMHGCDSCHAEHKTSAADTRAILKDHCGDCHQEEPDRYEVGERYARRMEAFRGELAKLAGRLSGPRRVGISRLQAADAHAAGEKVFSQTRVAQHGLRFMEKEIEESSVRLNGAYNNLSREEQNFAKRFIWLGAFLALVAVNAGVVRIKARQYRKGNP